MKFQSSLESALLRFLAIRMLFFYLHCQKLDQFCSSELCFFLLLLPLLETRQNFVRVRSLESWEEDKTLDPFIICIEPINIDKIRPNFCLNCSFQLKTNSCTPPNTFPWFFDARLIGFQGYFKELQVRLKYFAETSENRNTGPQKT